MEKIIFTTCTAAYLAQAKSLGDSILQTNPGYRLCIGLVDKMDGRFDPAFFAPHEIIPVALLSIPPFADMQSRYSLLELSCALKPWFALYLLEKYKTGQIIYMDTDIRLTGSLVYLEEELSRHSILLTPHIMSPLPADDKRPHETAILKTGIYNAGFFAVKNDENGNAFLNWWRDILVDYCYEDSSRGLASDQSWLNFVPLFFKNVKIIDHPGCNVAYWNMHERKLEKAGESLIVNTEFPLLFFHFSGYSMKNPALISRHQDRFKLTDNPVVAELFRIYHAALKENRHEEMQNIPCAYARPKSILKKLGLGKK